MPIDHDRIRWNCRAMEQAGCDALVCSLPENVLLLSGYWPVVGNAIAIATRDGRVAVAAPRDELLFARAAWADPIESFQAGSLDELKSAAEAVRPALRKIIRGLGLDAARFACDCGGSPAPASYAASHLYGETLRDLVAEAAPRARLADGGEVLARLRARLTRREVEQVRRACGIANDAFRACADFLRPGMREREVDAFLRAALASAGSIGENERAHGFAWCMSGPNAARASCAFAHSSGRRLLAGDLVLVHCNSYLDGFWTDITRTFSLGRPHEKVVRMYHAVFEARQAALAAIRPGAAARDVDAAARSVLQDAGFGDAFRHATGHGVGFVAIDPNARPRLHPRSSDVLEPGMVFNLEPAIYLDGLGGIRECEVALVTENAVEVLTPFLETTEQLLVA